MHIFPPDGRPVPQGTRERQTSLAFARVCVDAALRPVRGARRPSGSSSGVTRLLPTYCVSLLDLRREARFWHRTPVLSSNITHPRLEHKRGLLQVGRGWPSSGNLWCFCSDFFFDFVHNHRTVDPSHPRTISGYASMRRARRGSIGRSLIVARGIAAKHRDRTFSPVSQLLSLNLD